ncbi:Sec39 domain-containing protein [Podospora australis]|uniref:Sec39 domain-containing protein n=1 Tax=Podospora australis TaxID=1536484 RepID=A0AAN6WU35_9PEZI|nr:Sec39 domain-containing protein [Podospora australis]
MALVLSPAKLVLLAVHYAVKADMDSLTILAARHDTILRKELLLRIILTYLPETLQSNKYVAFLEQLEKGELPDPSSKDVDASSVESLSEDEATKRVRKLRLLPLKTNDTPVGADDDPISLFLIQRAYKVDEEAGLLNELPSLLLPFLDHSSYVRTLLVSTILPLLRRNVEYHPEEPVQYTLSAFQQLPDRVAVNLLLSQTGVREEDLPFVGRDLRGLVGPWLVDEKKWRKRRQSTTHTDGEDDDGICPGCDEVLRWITTQAAKNWKVAVSAVQQWAGPADADLASWGVLELTKEQHEHVEHAYAQAALASAYFISETSAEALEGAYSMVAKVADIRDLEPLPPLSSALAILPPLAEQIAGDITSSRNPTYLRNNPLSCSNALTTPSNATVAFLEALVLSAHILTKAGCPSTVRRAGELALLQDEREQKAEATKFIHAISNNGPKSDDKYWMRARNEVLWLRSWGSEEASTQIPPKGIFSQLKPEFLEVEFLKALLSNTRYNLARSLYEDESDHPLDRKLLQETIYATAMTAYDNASNPNRTRGGLKKCDEIIKALPNTIAKTDPIARRTESLLKATHALSEYRLVLKQGEPFTPIVLRVHKDPISIIGKILEQNPKSYTRLQDFLDLGKRMVQAGLTSHDKSKGTTFLTPEEEANHISTAERRIAAMCIDAALTEDDFETAYSYVVNRLGSLSAPSANIQDDYSWKAALQAGKYRRTARTVRPTHLGHSSANADIRHLEQRIECLATALRIAPPPTLQEILNAFRRAEEELDAALKAEEEQEEEWDARGDTMHGMPGGFNTTIPTTSGKGRRSSTSAGKSSSRREQQEEAPMSLFDLARASGLTAQRNISALSGLQRAATGLIGGGGGGNGARSTTPGPGRNSSDSTHASEHQQHSLSGSVSSLEGGEEHKRARKRDQLREAAMSGLVSGVGWLVGAPGPTAPARE